jgi:hypothetical protein
MSLLCCQTEVLFQNISNVTEVGLVTKTLLIVESKEWNCGGTFNCGCNDFEHRLKPKNFLISLHFQKKILEIADFEIEVEYAEPLVNTTWVSDGKHLILINNKTACLA